MKKLFIKSKDEYSNYILEDNKNNIYEANINFIDIESPIIGAHIFIPEDELIIIIQNNKKLYLQRFYG